MAADFPMPGEDPLRILMTCDTLGDTWRYAIDLSRELCRCGHGVTLAAMGPAPSRAQRLEAAGIEGLMLRSRACKLVWMDDPWSDLRATGEWLLRLAAEVRPDIVHANGFGHVALAWPAPVLCMAHSCMASWWRAVYGVPAPARWDRYREHVRAALQAADTIAAPSRAMAMALHAEYGLQRPVRVISAGIRGHAVTCKKRALVFAAGRFGDEGKNLGHLAAVAPCVPWPVCVAAADVAPGDTRAAYLHVRQLGALRPSAMQRWFARAAIYALPARYEPLGLSVLEAAQAGCALVLGDISDLREYWDNAALFVPPDDGDALRDALLRLIGDDTLREHLGARARRRALFMTAALMADDCQRTYDEMLSRRTSTPHLKVCA